MLYLSNIDLNKNQLQNAQVHPLGTAPSSPVEGQIYFDSTAGDKKLYYYNGTQWIATGDTDTNNYVTAGSISSGTVTLTRQGLSAVTFAINNDEITNGAGYITSASLPTVVMVNVPLPTVGKDAEGATFTANQSGNSEFAVTLDLTEITLGTGLDSTATGLSLDLSEFGAAGTLVGTDEFIVLDGNAEKKKAANAIGLSIFDNDAGFITSSSLPTVSNATITLTAGDILDGGGAFTLNQSASETITFDLATGGAGVGTYGSTSDSIKIDTITLDAYGRVTNVATGATGQVNSIGTGSSTTISIGGTAIVPTVSTVTAAVANAGTALATGDQIYDFVTGQIANIPSGLSFEGSWNASTDSPDLSTATPDNGQFWIVSVAGTTDLDGIDEWAVGDWAIYVSTGAGTDGWQKVDNSSTLSGFGDTNQVTYWTSTGNVAGDSNFTFNPTSNNLSVGGTVTWSGGGSAESNTAYDNSITALNVTGDTTKTLTATQQDGGTLTTSWTDNNTEYSMMTASTLGLGKLASNTTQTVTASSVSATASRTYGIQKNSSNQLVVNVPWANTNSGGTVTGVTGVSPIAVTSSSTTPAVSIATATGSAIGAGNVAAGEGIDVSYSGGTATVSGENSSASNKGIVIVAPGNDISVSYASGTATVSSAAQENNTYAVTITDTATITHGLSSKDVIIQLFDVTSGETVYADVERVDTAPYNTATVTFATTPTNSIRVLVQKIG